MPREGDERRPFRICGAAATGAVAIKAEEGDGKKLPTFAMVAYTGAPMVPGGWWVPVIVDLDGVRVASQQRPILRQHDHTRIVGHSTEVKISPAGIEVVGVLSGAGPDAAEVIGLAKNGFPWQASIGAEPVRTERLEEGKTATVNGREVAGPLVISRETELGEISFVPLGADGDTSATVSASKGGSSVMYKAMLKAARATNPVLAAKYSDEEIDKMDEAKAKAALKECMKGEDDDKPKEDEEKPEAKAEDKKDDDKPADAKAAARQFAAAYRAEVAAERTRVNTITARCAKYPGVTVEANGAKVDLVTHAIEAGWTADQAELHALRASRANSVGGAHFYFPSAPELNDAVLECAVMDAGRLKLFDDDFYQAHGDRGRLPEADRRRIKAELDGRYPDKVRQAAHTLFKGRIGLQQLLTRIAAQHGYRGSEVIRDDGDLGAVAHHCMLPIRADGASTASIANVLANVLNKYLLQGYLFVEQAWKEVCAVRPVKDFKPTKSINLFGDFEYKELGPSNELQHASLQDQAFANQASTVGRIITISRTHIINDDLGALTQVPVLMGRGAGLKLNKTFWTKWLDMGKDDGGSTDFWALVHTIAGQSANANYIEGAATPLSSASLQTAKQTFDKQVDPKGNPLGVEAKILLYPVELDQTAWELLNSAMLVYGGASAAKQPANNRWVNKYRPVMSRYLSNSNFTGYSATAWWLLADPAELPVIEACFLNGQEAPTVQVAGPDFQFNTLGISTRGVFDFGVEKQNFRGGVKSKGAA